MARFGKIGIDPGADADQDGLSNYAEFWAGTDPLDARSTLAVSRAMLTDDGHMQIQWQTVTGKSYLVQRSADLLSWVNLGAPVTGDGTMVSIMDSAQESPDSQSFYRIQLANY